MTITFVKANGETTKAIATTNIALVPIAQRSLQTKTAPSNPNVVPFYSLDRQGWRSVDVSRLKEVKVD